VFILKLESKTGLHSSVNRIP